MVLQYGIVQVTERLTKNRRGLFHDAGKGDDEDKPAQAVGYCVIQGKCQRSQGLASAGGHCQRKQPRRKLRSIAHLDENFRAQLVDR
ncbi:hypothetical protein D9M71_641240 [compost metagenome]